MFNKLIAVLLLLCAFTAEAQQRPIKVVIPFGVGGLVDNLTRRFAEALEEDMGRKFIIEAKPGAAGYIGLKQLAMNKSDEVLITVIDAMAVSNVILLHDDIVYEDFRYVTQLGVTTSIALAVKRGSPIKNVADLRAYRGRPLNIGINGLGGAHHYYNWLLTNQLPHTPVTEVAYKGVNEMLQNLIGGHIDLGWSNLASLEQQAAQGTIDIIAIIQQQRVDTSPNVQTFGEQGIIMPQNAKWLLISNQTTDLATVQQIDRSVRKLMTDAKFVNLIRTVGLVLEPRLTDQAATSMAASLKQQAKFIEYYRTQRGK
jgi:tripartite-type tricarboxylate transporter receptor subunit TctC